MTECRGQKKHWTETLRTSGGTMEKTAIVTDSNSGMFQKEADRWQIRIMPMPFLIEEKEYIEGTTLTREDFFRLQKEGKDIKTSQPSPAAILELWEELLESYEAVVYIPMTSGLSGSYETAAGLSGEFAGRVQVVDNHRISVTQKAAALKAAMLRDEGKNAVRIREMLESEADAASIYLAVDDLNYLKKGGRITPAVAAVGAVLNIKPVLQIPAGRIDVLSKARGMKRARQMMVEQVREDLKGKFFGKQTEIHTAYAGPEELGKEWHAYVQREFPDYNVTLNGLPLSISCHTGPGAIGIGCFTAMTDPDYRW